MFGIGSRGAASPKAKISGRRLLWTINFVAGLAIFLYVYTRAMILDLLNVRAASDTTKA
jgi:hypothetical protein